MLKGMRRKKLRATPLPPRRRRVVEEYCLFFSRLPEDDRRELEGHIQVFLAEKQFEGCGGFVMGDEHRLCIAAQACLLLLHRETDYFPRLRSILIYPAMYEAMTTHVVGLGIHEERRQARAGESWAEGVVVLAWDEVSEGLNAPERGHNVTLHEFAHQLDYEDGGYADGVPLLGRSGSLIARHKRQAEWRRVMRKEYEQLRAQAQRGEATFLNQYGTTNPAEFFAVVTESFFCRAPALREKHGELYEQMQWYYQQDPAGWENG